MSRAHTVKSLIEDLHTYIDKENPSGGLVLFITDENRGYLIDNFARPQGKEICVVHLVPIRKELHGNRQNLAGQSADASR